MTLKVRATTIIRSSRVRLCDRMSFTFSNPCLLTLTTTTILLSYTASVKGIIQRKLVCVCKKNRRQRNILGLAWWREATLNCCMCVKLM